MSEPQAPAGLFASLRQLLGTVLEIAHVRLTLLSNEIEQEKLRLFDAVVRGFLALLLLMLGMLMLSAFVVVLLWDEHRLLALGALTAIYLGAGVWLLYSARLRLKKNGGPFSVSVAELERDRAGLDKPR